MRVPSARGLQERLHQAFELSIAAKAVLAGLETLSGLGLWFLKAQWIWDFAGWLTASELVVDVVHKAMLICGIQGYRNDSKVSLGRHLRDATGAALMVNNDRILLQNATMHVAIREG